MELTVKVLGAHSAICDDKWSVEGIFSYYRIYYIISGEAWCIYEGRRIELLRNHLYYFPKNLYYEIHHNIENPLNHTWFHFDCAHTLGDEIRSLDLCFEYTVYSMIRVLEYALVQNRNERIISGQINLLVDVLSESGFITVSITSPIKRVISYIDQHYQYDISIDKLSEIAGFSRTYFSKIFKDITSKSPKKYLDRVRIDKASKLLIGGETVKSAAQKCGFNDSKTFMRTFKRETGFTPSEFKKSANNHI